MERKSLVQVAKDWLIFSIVVSPLVAGSYLLGDVELKSTFSEFTKFLFGDVEAITPTSLTSSIIPTLIVLGVIATSIWVVVDDIIAITLGSPKRTKGTQELIETPLIRLLFVYVFVSVGEELIFRGFLLGILPLVFTGSTSLYVLVIISSLAFAALHIFNYKRTDGYLVKIIPFFLEALLFAFIFLKFGILAAFLIHYIHNFLSALSFRFSSPFLKECE